MPEQRTYYEIVRDCCSESTTHGIPYLFKREQLPIKIAWLLCTVISAGVCGWLVSQSITDYYSYETVTQAKIVFETPTYFPAVSICSLNMLTTQEAFDYVSQYSAEASLPDSSYFLTYYFYNDIDFLRYGFGVNLLDKNFTDEDRQKMGFQLDKMMLSCFYNNNWCWTYDFYWFFDPYYGSCFTFNGGKDSSGQTINDRISTKAGSMFGLQLELFVGNPMNTNSYSFMNGLHVIVHNKTEKPTYMLGAKASVGQHTAIQVSRTFSSRLEKPYSDCIEDIESYAEKSLYVKTILESNYTYKQSDCYNVCLQKYFMNDCGCYMIDTPFWNASMARPCRFNETFCFRVTMSYFFAGDLTSLCGDDCPLECESISYMTSASTAVYPSDIFASKMLENPYLLWVQDLPSNMTIEQLRSNILSINVHYSSLSYQSFSEVEKTSVVDLVSGIGGTLGLFLGVSFLSFIELFDLIFCLLVAFHQRSKGASQVTNGQLPPASLTTTDYRMNTNLNLNTKSKKTFGADLGIDNRTNIA